jgi:fucose 4-O-acetylase-like acetyltransferase
MSANMPNNRNQTLDISKGIGIILVVFGHNWMVSHGSRELFRVIFSFHMPLFLFLSGVFLNENSSLREFSISRMHSLLKPYFATLTILGLIKLSSDVVNKRNFSANFLDYMGGVLYGTGSTIVWPPLWYLPHLFIVLCIALLMIKLVQLNKTKWLILAISLGTGVFLLNPRDLPWSLDLVPISLFFVVAGYLCRKFVNQMVFDVRYWFLSLLLFVFLHYRFDDTIDLNLRIYDNFLVSTVQAILGIYLCLSIASFLTTYGLAAKLLGYIGSGTLFILLFHSYIQDKTFGLLAKPLGESLLTGIGSLAAGVVVPLLLWECCRRSFYVSALLLPKVTPRVSRA